MIVKDQCPEGVKAWTGIHFCPRCTSMGEQGALLMGEPRTGATQPQRKKPRKKSHLPVLGHQAQNEPCREKTPAWFISRVYLQLKPAWASTSDRNAAQKE